MQKLNLTQEVVTQLTEASHADFMGTVWPAPGCPTCCTSPVR